MSQISVDLVQNKNGQEGFKDDSKEHDDQKLIDDQVVEAHREKHVKDERGQLEHGRDDGELGNCSRRALEAVLLRRACARRNEIHVRRDNLHFGCQEAPQVDNEDNTERKLDDNDETIAKECHERLGVADPLARVEKVFGTVGEC